jgi:hypothetical protein
MTRKDYELIARTLKAYADADALTRQGTATKAEQMMHYRLKGIADSLSYSLQQDNPRFNRETFLKACGL